MPFPMKIQPIDIDYKTPMEPSRADSAKPVLKTRLKRLFDRQFRSSAGGEAVYGKEGGVATEFEPSSVYLDKLVRNFIEESSENKQSAAAAAKYGRNRCSNCFNGTNIDSSDDEFDVFGDSLTGSCADAFDSLKSLIPCPSVAERNLLADTAKIVEKNRNQKHRKDDLRKIVTEELSSLGYDSSICRSKWEKSPSFPAGDYEYIDLITAGGDRLLIDIDFRSEFEIARSTATYRAVLQSVPYIFVGKPDRLQQTVSIVSEAAKQSLKKKGMHLPPWRKVEYMLAKWLSPYTRASSQHQNAAVYEAGNGGGDEENTPIEDNDSVGELELIFPSEEQSSTAEESESCGEVKVAAAVTMTWQPPAVTMTWQPPAVKPKSVDRKGMKVTGLAYLLREKP